MLRLLAFLPVILLASPAAAQDQADALAGFKLNLRSSQDVVAGETFKADRDYLDKHGKPEAAAFTVVVPLSGDGSYESRVVETPQTGLVKFVFATEGGGLIEAVSFSELTLPLAEEEPRLKYLMEMMMAVAVGQFVDNKPEASRQNVRKVTVGGRAAVEIFGTYVDPDFGKVHWRLVGLPDPEEEAGVVALAQIVEAAVPIGSPDDFPSSLSGRVLESLSFE